MNPVKILTVDDSKMVRLMVGRAFKRFECILLEANNGAEALEIGRQENPNLILLDYTMPVMDGLETMTALCDDPALRAIPVIMLTAEGSKDIMVKMASLGVRDYLIKPFKEEILIARVTRILPLLTRPHPVSTST